MDEEEDTYIYYSLRLASQGGPHLFTKRVTKLNLFTKKVTKLNLFTKRVTQLRYYHGRNSTRTKAKP